MFFKSSFLAWAGIFLSSSLLLAAAPTKVSGGNSDFPGLLEATTEELAGGLKKGLFTSVDLVNVSLILATYSYCFLPFCRDQG